MFCSGVIFPGDPENVISNTILFHSLDLSAQTSFEKKNVTKPDYSISDLLLLLMLHNVTK